MEGSSFWVAVTLVVIALIFNFTNGFHDAANAIATVVATKTLTPLQAVLMAAFFNMVVVFYISFNVAATIAKNIVDPGAVNLTVLFACLASSIAWNLVTWWFGLPSSSSHALIGGLLGAGVTSAGWGVVKIGGLTDVIMWTFIAPVMGFGFGAVFNWLMRRMLADEGSSRYDKWFHRLQLMSSAAYAMGHGANDAQKSAGIIFLILIASGIAKQTDSIPEWAIWSSYLVMGAGTLSGGWRIIDTMARKLTHLNPRQGFAANAGGSIMLFTASAAGVPVSTTHTIAGAIMGVGTSEPGQPVQWGKATEIVIAWVLTIPATAVIAAVFYLGTATIVGS